MFPIPFNFPFRKKDGSITTMDDAISSGGGSYTLPTASASVKGGVKIGDGLGMSGEVLKVSNPIPTHSSIDSGKVLTVNDEGEMEWDTPTGGIPLITKTEWDALTISQKREYELVAVEDSITGYERGVLVDGRNAFNAIRVWTQSTGGSDASMNAQMGVYVNDVFTPLGAAVNKIYTSIQNPDYFDCWGVARLTYYGNWFLYAERDVIYNNNEYSNGETINTWTYNVEVDMIITY